MNACTRRYTTPPGASLRGSLQFSPLTAPGARASRHTGAPHRHTRHVESDRTAARQGAIDGAVDNVRRAKIMSERDGSPCFWKLGDLRLCTGKCTEYSDFKGKLPCAHAL